MNQASPVIAEHANPSDGSNADPVLLASPADEEPRSSRFRPSRTKMLFLGGEYVKLRHEQRPRADRLLMVSDDRMLNAAEFDRLHWRPC